jgi:hypothetical protein
MQRLCMAALSVVLSRASFSSAHSLGFLSAASRLGPGTVATRSSSAWLATAAAVIRYSHSQSPTSTMASSSSPSRAPPGQEGGQGGLRTLETLAFDNLALRALPVDPEARNYVRPVRNSVYSRVMPTPVKNPRIVAVSDDVS